MAANNGGRLAATLIEYDFFVIKEGFDQQTVEFSEPRLPLAMLSKTYLNVRCYVSANQVLRGLTVVVIVMVTAQIH